MTLSLADQANQRMVDHLIALGALWSPSLIAAFRATPRHRFLDRVFQYHHKHDCWREVRTREPGPEELRLLYSERALITRLSCAGRRGAELPSRSSSQPSLMAQMLEDMRPEAGQRILEIGAGTGYNAALLAHVAGPDCVVSVDVDRQVLSEASEHVRAFPERRIVLHHADGRHGYSEAAPFDRILVTAATPHLEPAWLEQLTEHGRLLAPLVLAPGLAYVACGGVRDGMFEGRLTRPAYFMPLRAEGEAGEAEPAALPFPSALRTVPAPWAIWLDRRKSAMRWPGFVQAGAFCGWAAGMNGWFHPLGQGENPICLSDAARG